jgi:activator of 2-hydroxyglutaryl-CoA dehydratase
MDKALLRKENILAIDCGTTWSKLRARDKSMFVVKTEEILSQGFFYERGTGQMAARCCTRTENELVALARGALKLVSEPDFIIVDIGARDIKYIKFKQRVPQTLDWNRTCGALFGFTFELLATYFNLDLGKLPFVHAKDAVTCGVLGIEQVFEQIRQGKSASEAVAEFSTRVAKGVYKFLRSPSKIYLSGGMCENHSFVYSMKRYCQVKSLGRFVPLLGLF